MSLSDEDAHVLKAAGFIDYELEQLSEAKTPEGKPQPPINLDSPVWQLAIKSRRDWINGKISEGWSEYDIRSEIMAYYSRDKRRDIFGFLKAEYKPPLKKDFQDAVQARSQRMINRGLGRYYK